MSKKGGKDKKTDNNQAYIYPYIYFIAYKYKSNNKNVKFYNNHLQ